jgi:hypothetical protein
MLFIDSMIGHTLCPVVHVEPEDSKMKNCNSANGRYLAGAVLALVGSIAMVAMTFGHAVSNMSAFV